MELCAVLDEHHDLLYFIFSYYAAMGGHCHKITFNGWSSFYSNVRATPTDTYMRICPTVS